MINPDVKIRTILGLCVCVHKTSVNTEEPHSFSLNNVHIKTPHGLTYTAAAVQEDRRWTSKHYYSLKLGL